MWARPGVGIRGGMNQETNPAATPLQRASAFAVHLLTASGAALALLALLAAAERRWTLMFTWLTLAIVIDAVDGALARWLRVKTVLPRWSGDVLDLVVDILTYVFIPAYALIAAGLFPEPVAVPLGLLVVVTGVLYFADLKMKSFDNYFIGFPAIWNVVAFYLFLLRPAPWLAAALVAALAALTFVPFPFVHPLRVPHRRTLNAALAIACVVLAGVALTQDLRPGAWITAPLAAVGLYFLTAGFLRPKVRS